MTQKVLDHIDDFIDSRSSLEVSEHEEIRVALYQALVKRVGEDWTDYMKFYQAIFDNLKDDYTRGLLNTKASKLQDMCTQVVNELEEIESVNYSQSALFRAKELVVQFRGAMDLFKEEIKSEFSV